MKKVLTVSGIRPDFIRMSEVFKRFDERFDHILCHSGQHFSIELSDIFFDELEIRQPDFNLHCGAPGRDHAEQSAVCSIELVKVLRQVKPDLVVYLGDTNTVVSALAVRKEGFKVAHIEACMRSYDMRMLEELNRIVCDHMSNLLLAYHEDYKQQGMREGIASSMIRVVGNTIVEPVMLYGNSCGDANKKKDFILVDIHRPENFNYKDRFQNIIDYIQWLSLQLQLPVRMLSFGRSAQKLQEFNIDTGDIIIEPVMSFKKFLQAQYDAFCVVSDSGTSQEETCLLRTPVVIPRDYTERPQSFAHNCSFQLNANSCYNSTWQKSLEYIWNTNDNPETIDTGWLGVGRASYNIANEISKYLENN